jgi:alpha-amylase/alpha-mannosidase (GH57 family)
MERYICIHGHFYQPPRENPWLEFVEYQDSAYPFHDWNARITAECYQPNTVSHILDQENFVRSVVDNYSKISFNFGPTLLSWMERAAAETYQAILEADKQSADNFSGHGSALAQCYNHIIMPLANHRDKMTQVVWGIEDFKRRFKRDPEGMWLPETAADKETLLVLAQNGIKYTILAPGQASRFHDVSGRDWVDVHGGRIDPTRPYWVDLGGGSSIVVFFYDGPISQAVAFERLLENGERFASRLLSGFKNGRHWPQLIHIATDGETYGHHHKHGEMALAYAINYIEENHLAKLTNYGEYLSKYPVTAQAEIVDNTSWSCSHGIERWRNDCGCSSGSRVGWNQKWRAPLREAFDWLRDTITAPYQEAAASYFKDPWDARDAYIDVIYSRVDEGIETFFGKVASRDLSNDERIRALKLLEMQRHALLMYTSCGWFFDEISGIETTQCLQYADRVLQLAEELFEQKFEGGFLAILEKAPSNLEIFANARQVYDKYIRPARVHGLHVAAHYALMSVFRPSTPTHDVYSFKVETVNFEKKKIGEATVALGDVRIQSTVTKESLRVLFAVLHLGDHNINAGAKTWAHSDEYGTLKEELFAAFQEVDVPKTIRCIDKYFGKATYSLKSLFKDEQRMVISKLLESSLTAADDTLSQLHTTYLPLMSFLSEMDNYVPKVYRDIGEFIENTSLYKELKKPEIEVEAISELLKDGEHRRVNLDRKGLRPAFEQAFENHLVKLNDEPQNLKLLSFLNNFASLLHGLPFRVDFRSAQTAFHNFGSSVYADWQKNANWDDPEQGQLKSLYDELANKLKVRLPQVQ